MFRPEPGPETYIYDYFITYLSQLSNEIFEFCH